MFGPRNIDVAETSYARLRSLKIGQEIYTNLYCARMSNTNLPSEIGLEFLRLNRTILNYPDRLVNFQRVRPQDANDHNMSGLGIKWSKAGRPVIHAIEENSPAAQSDLEEGNEILKIDKMDVEKLSKFRIYELLRKAENEELVIESLRGTNRITARLVLKPRL